MAFSNYILVLIISVLVGCSQGMVNNQPKDDLVDDDLNEVSYSFSVDMSQTFQEIKGFGASDAWSIQFVGKNWIGNREDIAELLFSYEKDATGGLTGIGLSMWRFNIGAGSVGDEVISDEWRRAETFLNSDGSYDWSRQSGQQWFLSKAYEYGVSHITAFANSPPIHLTKNGKAYGNGDWSNNLHDGDEGLYASYLCDVLEYLNADEERVRYISPINEPQWNWSAGNGQEGALYTNRKIFQVVNALDNELASRGLNVNIEMPEAAQLNFLYEEYNQTGDQFNQFFTDDGEYMVIGLTSVTNEVAAHSYFTTWPVEKLIQTRRKIGEIVDTGTMYNMSEYCVLEDNSEITGHSRVGQLDPALYVARIMHYDLTEASASSWNWWLAVSPYEYNDGLIYIDKDKFGGEYSLSKTFWVMGNYSAFIRPGARRVFITDNKNDSETIRANNIMASAYYDASNNKFISVIINYSDEEEVAVLDFDSDTDVIQMDLYVTSDQYDLQRVDSVGRGDSFVVPARSVVTLVGNVR